MMLRLTVMLLGVALCAQQHMDDAAIRSSVEAYRRAWQAMSPEQRKSMADNGGATPEQYEQTLRARPGGESLRPAAGGQRLSNTDVGSMVRTSSEDLNRIRDANLVLLKDETCPTDTALELAALRSRSAAGVMPPRAALLDLAENWSKRVAVANRPAADSPVDALLGVSKSETSSDAARTNAEIERLLTGCRR